MRAFLGLLLGGILGFMSVPIVLVFQGVNSDDVGAGSGLMAIFLASLGAILGAIVGASVRRKV